MSDPWVAAIVVLLGFLVLRGLSRVLVLTMKIIRLRGTRDGADLAFAALHGSVSDATLEVARKRVADALDEIEATAKGKRK